MSALKDVLAKLAYPILEYYRYLGFNKALKIKRVTKDGVFIFGKPVGNDKIFVLKLQSTNNSFLRTDFTNLRTSVRHLKDSQLAYFFVKQGEYQMGYLATLSEQVAINIADNLKLPICSPEETVEFLLDVFSVNTYDVSKDHFDIQPHITAEKITNDNFFDPLYYNFSTVIRDGVASQFEKYSLYQGVKFSNKLSFDYANNFSKDFNGILALYIDLSDVGVNFTIDNYLSYAKTLDSKLKDDFSYLKEQNQVSPINAVVSNVVILSDSDREAKNTASSFGFEVIKKDYDKINILRKTLLLTREMDYDKLLPIGYVSNIVGVRTRKNVTRHDCKKLEKPWTQVSVDFWGEDLYGGFVNFCFRANNNPHNVFIGDAGTGKSVAVQKILSSIYRTDFKNENVGRWEEVQTRYFEVGYSSSQLVKFYKGIYPNDVGVIEGALDNMKFNAIDVKTSIGENGRIELDEESRQMSVYLVNIILKEGNSEPLNAQEQKIYNESLEKLYKEKKYKSKTIAELRRMSKEAYLEYENKFLKAGHTGTTRLDEITDCGDIENLQKPVVDDLINLIEMNGQSTNLSETEKMFYQSTSMKLKAVKAVEGGLFGGLNAVKLDGKRFYTFEFNNISNNKALLRIVFSFLFVSVYSDDVKRALQYKAQGKKMPQTMYLFEESRNFVEGNDEIIAMMKKIMFEGRKFQIHAYFIAQQVEHIPLQLIKGSSSFMFLMPKEQEKAMGLKKDIREIFGTLDSVEFLLENIKQHTVGIISTSGTFACKMAVTEEEIALFSV